MTPLQRLIESDNIDFSKLLAKSRERVKVKKKQKPPPKPLKYLDKDERPTYRWGEKK
jgi:hypothetical protein